MKQTTNKKCVNKYGYRWCFDSSGIKDTVCDDSQNNNNNNTTTDQTADYINWMLGIKKCWFSEMASLIS